VPALPTSYPRNVTAAEIANELGPFDEITAIGDRSGSGECWLVRNGLDQAVIKVVVREHEPGRFDREVEALARLNSPRIMRVLDRGEITSAAATYPYLKSEFVPGGSVRQALDTRASPDDDELRAFLVEFLAGLAELDAARIVHRDLKPENIILRDGRWDQPVIIDLGLSRLVDTTTFTVYPWAGGTWPYMAPEVLRLERATHLSDVWAAAIISLEVATGAHPFRQPADVHLPGDWDARLQAGPIVPGMRPAAFNDWATSGTEHRAYRRPKAQRAMSDLEAYW
jgi:serine/threonine protein kinase